MYNPHTMYLIGKEREAEFIRQAEQRRQAKLAKKEDSQIDFGIVIGIAARVAILITLAIVVNVSG
jgi:hypothetical protein